MRLISPLFLSGLMAICVLSVACAEVSVSLENGHTFTGEVDSRSDAGTLWVRRMEGGIVLTSAVSWDEIADAQLDGQRIGIAELARNVSAYATNGPRTFLTEYELLDRNQVPQSLVPRDVQLRVASIEVDAVVVNLDRTVEADGLRVALAVLDDHGNAVPIRGSLSARLIVERLDPHTGQVSFEEFQRWSAPVSLVDFRDGIAELSLRFRRASPEFSWDLCTAALLNVRLGVFGQGNFAASVPVAIHEFNPIRDEMRNQQGSRFYRDELTHNSRHDGPRQLHRGFGAPRTYGF